MDPKEQFNKQAKFYSSSKTFSAGESLDILSKLISKKTFKLDQCKSESNKLNFSICIDFNCNFYWIYTKLLTTILIHYENRFHRNGTDNKSSCNRCN